MRMRERLTKGLELFDYIGGLNKELDGVRRCQVAGVGLAEVTYNFSNDHLYSQVQYIDYDMIYETIKQKKESAIKELEELGIAYDGP